MSEQLKKLSEQYQKEIQVMAQGNQDFTKEEVFKLKFKVKCLTDGEQFIKTHLTNNFLDIRAHAKKEVMKKKLDLANIMNKLGTLFNFDINIQKQDNKKIKFSHLDKYEEWLQNLAKSIINEIQQNSSQIITNEIFLNNVLESPQEKQNVQLVCGVAINLALYKNQRNKFIDVQKNKAILRKLIDQFINKPQQQQQCQNLFEIISEDAQQYLQYKKANKSSSSLQNSNNESTILNQLNQENTMCDKTIQQEQSTQQVIKDIQTSNIQNSNDTTCKYIPNEEEKEDKNTDNILSLIQETSKEDSNLGDYSMINQSQLSNISYQDDSNNKLNEQEQQRYDEYINNNQTNGKSMLQELIQKYSFLKGKTPVYTYTQEGDSHKPVYTANVELELDGNNYKFQGEDKKKKDAEKWAALRLICKLESQISKYTEIEQKKEISTVKVDDRNGKTQLQEFFQKFYKGKNIPQCQLIGQSGENHNPTFEVSIEFDGIFETGKAGKKKDAESEASKKLLNKLIQRQQQKQF